MGAERNGSQGWETGMRDGGETGVTVADQDERAPLLGSVAPNPISAPTLSAPPVVLYLQEPPPCCLGLVHRPPGVPLPSLSRPSPPRCASAVAVSSIPPRRDAAVPSSPPGMRPPRVRLATLRHSSPVARERRVPELGEPAVQGRRVAQCLRRVSDGGVHSSQHGAYRDWSQGAARVQALPGRALGRNSGLGAPLFALLLLAASHERVQPVPVSVQARPPPPCHSSIVSRARGGCPSVLLTEIVLERPVGAVSRHSPEDGALCRVEVGAGVEGLREEGVRAVGHARHAHPVEEAFGIVEVFPGAQ